MFQKSAEFGNAKAQRWLGACYYFGTGIREDKQEAVKWYRLAADQGTRKPSGGWETVIFLGRRNQEDKQEAVKWYRLAAEQGGRGSPERTGRLL